MFRSLSFFRLMTISKIKDKATHNYIQYTNIEKYKAITFRTKHIQPTQQQQTTHKKTLKFLITVFGIEKADDIVLPSLVRSSKSDLSTKQGHPENSKTAIP